LSRSTARSAGALGPALPWRRALLTVAGLAAAVALGLLIFELLMAPPRSAAVDLALYLVLSGGTTIVVGWVALRVADQRIGLSLRVKAIAAATIGSLVGLANVYMVARLMFVSTTHDLPLLSTLLIFSGVIAASFSVWVASSVTGRVHVIGRAVGVLAEGRYDTRVALEGRDEVAMLARDVDRLAARLEASERQRAELERSRRELTAAISHDLRTPLASVRAMVEALSDGLVEDRGEVERYLGTMHREIDRLSRMLDDLFELAQIDAGALRLERRPLSLAEIAADVGDAMQAQAQRAGVRLDVEAAELLPLLDLDGARMERAVANLLRNAIEHTPRGGAIRVRADATAGEVTVSVEDTGEGIAPEDLERVWEPFYRGDRSRQRGAASGDGAGLGLSIVRGIVEAHGGRVTARSAPGAGATFTIHLPRG
jgi:signal transduction histidine kinase